MGLTRDRLVTYLEDKLKLDTNEVNDTAPLFSTGVIDSFGMVEVIGFLESECALKIGPGDVNLENLDSIERIVAFAERKTGA